MHHNEKPTWHNEDPAQPIFKKTKKKNADFPECFKAAGVMHKERDGQLYSFNSLFANFKRHIFNVEKWKNMCQVRVIVISSCNNLKITVD